MTRYIAHVKEKAKQKQDLMNILDKHGDELSRSDIEDITLEIKKLNWIASYLIGKVITSPTLNQLCEILDVPYLYKRNVVWSKAECKQVGIWERIRK